MVSLCVFGSITLADSGSMCDRIALCVLLFVLCTVWSSCRIVLLQGRGEMRKVSNSPSRRFRLRVEFRTKFRFGFPAQPEYQNLNLMERLSCYTRLSSVGLLFGCQNATSSVNFQLLHNRFLLAKLEERTPPRSSLQLTVCVSTEEGSESAKLLGTDTVLLLSARPFSPCPCLPTATALRLPLLLRNHYHLLRPMIPVSYTIHTPRVSAAAFAAVILSLAHPPPAV